MPGQHDDWEQEGLLFPIIMLTREQESRLPEAQPSLLLQAGQQRHRDSEAPEDSNACSNSGVLLAAAAGAANQLFLDGESKQMQGSCGC